ncbi:MAG: hypothetical protein J6A77_02695, partial [Lachnospiraceae bacterium]|nr:hypothetical protein [Lachnospiraceae bacterium]
NKVFYAHTKNNSTEKETLKEHTELCCSYFLKIFPEKQYERFYQRFSTLCGMEHFSVEAKRLIKDMWYDVPFFHDIGKINPIFQQNRMNQTIADLEGISVFGFSKGSHSLFSAVLYITGQLKV